MPFGNGGKRVRKRKLDSIRTLEREAESTAPPIAYNPGMMTDPLPAVERAMAAFRRRVRGNPVMSYQKARVVLGELRSLTAEVFGGDARGWAVGDGHTSTVDRLAQSLAEFLGDGAVVVSTLHEHVGGLGAFSADRRFIVQELPIRELVHAPAQVFFLSHLTYDTNIDNREVIQTLVRRPDSPIVIVDGCQALGQVRVNVRELGCHAYLASAHKWLGGPHGAGLLYLREDALDRWPSPFRAGVPLCPDLPIGHWEPRGGQDFSRIAGLAAAVRAFQCHGHADRGVRERFTTGLRESLGDRVHVLTTSTGHGRVVVFELTGVDVYPVYQRLMERGVSVKCIKKSAENFPDGRALEVLRVGFPWWNEAADVDLVIQILSEVVRDVGGAASPAPKSAVA